MGEAKYNIYNFYYKINSDDALFAVVSSGGLTDAESLLEKQVKEKRKSSEGFNVKKIDATVYRSDKEGVIFNSFA